MDTFFDFLPVLIILWIVVRVLRGGNRRKTAARTPPPVRAGTTGAPAPRPGGSPFEELVRRIEAAAAEASRQNTATTKARTQPPALPRPPLRAVSAAAMTAARRTDRAASDEERRFRALDAAAPLDAPAAPGSDFRFVGAIDEPLQPREFHEAHARVRDGAPSSHMPSVDMPSAHLHDPRRSDAPRIHPLAARFRTPAGAREALILKEVLSPPRSRRR